MLKSDEARKKFSSYYKPKKFVFDLQRYNRLQKNKDIGEEATAEFNRQKETVKNQIKLLNSLLSTDIIKWLNNSIKSSEPIDINAFMSKIHLSWDKAVLLGIGSAALLLIAAVTYYFNFSILISVVSALLGGGLLLWCYKKSKEIHALRLEKSFTYSEYPYSIDQVHQSLFKGETLEGHRYSKVAKDQENQRLQLHYKPEISTDGLKIKNQKFGNFINRIVIYSGGITDIKIAEGKKGAIACSTACSLNLSSGGKVATAVVNAAGAELQYEIYKVYESHQFRTNPKYGCQGSSEAKYAESLGYAVSCGAYDMAKTHNMIRVELMSMPWNDQRGFFHAYYEAFTHSKDLDYLIVPVAGATHEAIKDKKRRGGVDYGLSASIAMSAFAKFMHENPESKLKVVFAIYKDKEGLKAYNKCAHKFELLYQKNKNQSFDFSKYKLRHLQNQGNIKSKCSVKQKKAKSKSQLSAVSGKDHGPSFLNSDELLPKSNISAKKGGGLSQSNCGTFTLTKVAKKPS